MILKISEIRSDDITNVNYLSGIALVNKQKSRIFVSDYYYHTTILPMKEQ
jgi:hypothetical protein